MGPHDRFLELCAVSTSGDLTEEEQKNLQVHLADCPDCQRALKEFEAAADIGMPLLHSALSADDSLEPGAMLTEATSPMPAGTVGPMKTAHTGREPKDRSSGVSSPSRNNNRYMRVNWNYVWMPLAAAIVLTVALGIYSFQVGKQKGQEVVRVPSSTVDKRVDALEQTISDAGHEREALKMQLAARDQMIAELRRQIADQSSTLNEAKNSQVNLKQSLDDNETEKQLVAQEQSNLSHQLETVQASLQKTQAELDSLQKQRTQEQLLVDSLDAQIKDLHGQLHDRELDLGKQQELLAHDRDIRELMGARDLYIAEVYDVARDGQTQKPYGRVFYTKGKSLIFYAYDLDQQAGLKSASAFQAWGSHGLDRQQATSLGVFYQDNAAKKRWVVKFDDPKKLEQIDAVFVTVEPNGGSHKPSGKQLLFAYLKVDPNHP